jgi:hypothetical protein
MVQISVDLPSASNARLNRGYTELPLPRTECCVMTSPANAKAECTSYPPFVKYHFAGSPRNLSTDERRRSGSPHCPRRCSRRAAACKSLRPPVCGDARPRQERHSRIPPHRAGPRLLATDRRPDGTISLGTARWRPPLRLPDLRKEKGRHRRPVLTFSSPCLPAAECPHSSPWKNHRLHWQQRHVQRKPVLCQLGKILIFARR